MKRVRKANYSQEENLFLADKYEEFKGFIDAKHKDADTNKKKKQAWESIVTQHSARFPQVERSLEDLKARLSKLKSEAKERLHEAKKSKKITGGGNPPKEPTPAEQKILDMCEDTPGFKGLTGVESAPGETSNEDQGESAVGLNVDEDVGELFKVS